MMPRPFPSPISRIPLAVAFMACFLGLGPARADVRLGYHSVPGTVALMVIENDFQLPILGAQPSRLTVTTRVESAGPSGARLHQKIDRTAPQRPDRSVETALSISTTGEVTGPDQVPADTEGVFLAHTTLLLLPALPDALVREGSTWSADRNFPLPPIPIKAPSQVRVRTTYRVVSFSVAAGRPVVNLSMQARELKGEKLSLKYTGELTVDAATGRPLTGLLDGNISLPVAPFVSLPASFKIRLVSTSVDPAPVATRQHISLLGVE